MMWMDGIVTRIVRQDCRYRRLINPCTTQSVSVPEVVVRVRVDDGEIDRRLTEIQIE
jgi:hypothetical protein